MLFLIFIAVIILIGFCMFLNNAVNENSNPSNLEDDYNRNQLKDYYKSQSSNPNSEPKKKEQNKPKRQVKNREGHNYSRVSRSNDKQTNNQVSKTRKEDFSYLQMAKYIEAGIIPQNILDEIQAARLNGKNSILVPKGTKTYLETKYNQRIRFGQSFHNIDDSKMEIFDYSDLDKYIKYAVIPRDLFIDMERAMLKGKSSILVPKGTKAKLEVEYKEQLLQDQELSNVADLNNEGIALEKEGNIKEAINVYEENIATSDYPAHHSYKRLMVIYRRNKDYVNELRIINRALEIFPRYDEYVKRRERTLFLMKK